MDTHDPRDQAGRGVASRHRPRRRGGHHRSRGRDCRALVLRPHDLAFEQFGRHDIDLEGPLLADPLEGRRLGLHLRRLNDDGLLHRQVGERLRRHGARLGRGCRPLVADRRRWDRRGGDLRQFAQFERQLRLVQLLALTAAEEFFLQPFVLGPQDRVLLLKAFDAGEKLGDVCHSSC